MAATSGIKAGMAYIALTLNDADLARGINATSAAMRSSSTKLLEIGSGLAAATGALSAPFVLGARHMLNYVATLDFAAARVGIATQEFGRLAVVAKLTGTSVEALQIGTKTIGERLIQLQSGSAETVNAFKMLGISIQGFIGAGSNSKRFFMIADALSKIQDKGLQAGLALRTMGEAGLQLIPILDLGSERIQELQTRMREFAPTKQAIEAARELRYQWTLAGESLKMITVDIATNVAPGISFLAKKFGELAVSVRLFVIEHPNVSRIGGALAGLLATIATLTIAAGGIMKLVAALQKLALWGAALAGINWGYLGAALVALGGWASVIGVVAVGLGILADKFGVLNNLVAFGAHLWGLAVIGLGKYAQLLAKIGSYVPGLKNAARSLADGGRAAESYGRGYMKLTAAQIEEERKRRAFGDASGKGGGGMGGGALPIPVFTSAGIMGSQASQQTLGFAGIGGGQSPQSNLATIATESKQQTKELQDMNRRQQQQGTYKTW